MAEPTIEALRERPLQMDGCVRLCRHPCPASIWFAEPSRKASRMRSSTIRLRQVQPVTFRLYAPELSLTLQGNGDLHALDAQGICRFILPHALHAGQ